MNFVNNCQSATTEYSRSINMCSVNLLSKCKNVLLEEAQSIENVADKIDDNFLQALDLLVGCKGLIVITGLGKSGLIGKKLASTFSSIGKPSVFLHSAEAQHGDLGITSENDVVVCISKSGNTEEIVKLIPFFKKIGVPIISITNNPNSKLAKNSEVTIFTYVEKESCMINLAPTTSTTVTLAIGDALAVGLEYVLNLTPDQFAFSHPSGTLGKKLLLRIEDLMAKGEDIPKIIYESTLKDALIEITNKRLGFVCILNDNGKLFGIITDGDVRRLLEKSNTVNLSDNISDLYITTNPKTCFADEMAYDVLKKMNLFKINCMPVINNNSEIVGAIHIQELIFEFGA